MSAQEKAASSVLKVTSLLTLGSISGRMIRHGIAERSQRRKIHRGPTLCMERRGEGTDGVQQTCPAAPEEMSGQRGVWPSRNGCRTAAVGEQLTTPCCAFPGRKGRSWSLRKPSQKSRRKKEKKTTNPTHTTHQTNRENISREPIFGKIRKYFSIQRNNYK